MILTNKSRKETIMAKTTDNNKEMFSFSVEDLEDYKTYDIPVELLDELINNCDMNTSKCDLEVLDILRDLVFYAYTMGMNTMLRCAEVANTSELQDNVQFDYRN